MNYFNPSETRCKCEKCRDNHNGAQIQPQLLNLMNQIRKDWGRPLTVASGARCAEHNKAIGGAAKSAHVEGLAVDFAMPQGPTRTAFLAFIMSRLGQYVVRMEDPASTPSWVHIDLKPATSVGRIFKP